MLSHTTKPPHDDPHEESGPWPPFLSSLLSLLSLFLSFLSIFLFSLCLSLSLSLSISLLIVLFISLPSFSLSRSLSLSLSFHSFFLFPQSPSLSSFFLSLENSSRTVAMPVFIRQVLFSFIASILSLWRVFSLYCVSHFDG